MIAKTRTARKEETDKNEKVPSPLVRDVDTVSDGEVGTAGDVRVTRC